MNGNWQELGVGGTDTNVQFRARYQPCVSVHQARAICRALQICHEGHEENRPMEGWVKGCCQQASEELPIATGEKNFRLYRDFHEGKNCDIKSGDDSDKIVVVERFSWSLRGRPVKGSAVKSPIDAEFWRRGTHDAFQDMGQRKS